jgi:hypothetical protein
VFLGKKKLAVSRKLIVVLVYHSCELLDLKNIQIEFKIFFLGESKKLKTHTCMIFGPRIIRSVYQILVENPYLKILKVDRRAVLKLDYGEVGYENV